MGSSRGQDESLGTGISLPQWMRAKMDNRFDFDDSSFSPPSHDDSFFYIRYPKSEESRKNLASSSQEGYTSISQVLADKTNPTREIVGQTSGTSHESNVSKIKEVGNIDFSKHPLPCQPFVPATERNTVKPAAATFGSKFKGVKSQGTDDGFHSEPALCGKSIVHVANRIMSKRLTKIDAASEATEANKVMEQRNQDQFLTKGSKSLPVTPIASPISTPDTSPKSRRRAQGNRYFTGAFVPDREKYQTGWILAGILGQSREAAMANNKIQEEDEEAPSVDVLPSKYLNRKKSISSQNLSYVDSDETRVVSSSSTYQQLKQTVPVSTTVFQANPSELREMNFWSPTSM